MNTWYIIGYHIQLGSGVLRGPLDQFTAHRIKRDILHLYPSAHLLVIHAHSSIDATHQAADYIRSLGLEHEDISAEVLGSFTDFSFAGVDTIEFNSRDLNHLTARPGDLGYDSYLQMLDDIIQSDWSAVEETDLSLIVSSEFVISEKYPYILIDLHFRKNYLNLCGIDN